MLKERQFQVEIANPIGADRPCCVIRLAFDKRKNTLRAATSNSGDLLPCKNTGVKAVQVEVYFFFQFLIANWGLLHFFMHGLKETTIRQHLWRTHWNSPQFDPLPRPDQTQSWHVGRCEPLRQPRTDHPRPPFNPEKGTFCASDHWNVHSVQTFPLNHTLLKGFHITEAWQAES